MLFNPARILILIMKKKLLVIALLFITQIITLQAQNKPFQFGFQGAFNLGWYSTNAHGYSNNGVKVGGSWGFIADIFIMEGYSFTTGFNLLYLNGSLNMPHSIYNEQNDQQVVGKLKRDYKNQYLELPLIFTMKTNDINDKFRIYGQIGFGLGFLLSANSNDIFYPNEGGGQVNSDQNIDDEITFLRSSIKLGAGVEIPLHGSTYLRTGIGFDKALNNVLKGNNTANPDTENQGKNNLIELRAAVIF